MTKKKNLEAQKIEAQKAEALRKHERFKAAIQAMVEAEMYLAACRAYATFGYGVTREIFVRMAGAAFDRAQALRPNPAKA